MKLTGRSGKTDRTQKPQRSVVSSKLPEAYFFDRTQTSVRCNTLGTVQTHQFDRTHAARVRCFQTQRPVS